MITAIVAADLNWGIGYKGDLLIKIPEDMKRFRELTTGKTVIMGRKTYDSLPKKPLPDRKNIVLSRKYSELTKLDENLYGANISTITAWLENIRGTSTDVFIIGGEEIYAKLLPWCDEVLLTRIIDCFTDVDVFFPDLNDLPQWKLLDIGKVQDYTGIKYRFVTYIQLFE